MCSTQQRTFFPSHSSVYYRFQARRKKQGLKLDCNQEEEQGTLSKKKMYAVIEKSLTADTAELLYGWWLMSEGIEVSLRSLIG
jgi:hypothetical protein